MSKLKARSRGTPARIFSPFPASVCGQILPHVSVVVELEVEAAARLEGVKVERPGLVPSSSLLVLWVQRILAGVELLSHFWKEKGETLNYLAHQGLAIRKKLWKKSAPDLGRSGPL